MSPWSERRAYSDTAETSLYVEAGYRGQGVGTALKRAVIDGARALGFHVLIAQIAEGADASRHLSERFGFSHVGTLREVGRKFGQTLDVHLYQLILDQAGAGMGRVCGRAGTERRTGAWEMPRACAKIEPVVASRLLSGTPRSVEWT